MKIFLWLPLYVVALVPLPFIAAASPFFRGGEDDGAEADGLGRHLFPLKVPDKSEKKGGKGKGRCGKGPACGDAEVCANGVCLCGTSPSCSGGKECVSGTNRTFSQNLTAPGVIFGSGNDNGNFTINQEDPCIEIGIRGKLRYPERLGAFGDYSNGTYGRFGFLQSCSATVFDLGCIPPQTCCVLTSPVWSYDWSINVAKNSTSCPKKLKDYCYEVGLDADPSAGTDFTVFDPINPAASRPAWDHAIGNKDSKQAITSTDPPTPPTDGFLFPVSCNFATGETVQDCYKRGLSEYNVTQNSWNYEFNNDPGTSLFNFDSKVPGSYIVYFRVLDCSTKTVVAQNFIEVLVGNAPSAGNAVCLPSQKKGGCTSSSSEDSKK